MNTQMPIGVDDFKEVRENYYFVDKTHFIQSLIDGDPVDPTSSFWENPDDEYARLLLFFRKRVRKPSPV